MKNYKKLLSIQEASDFLNLKVSWLRSAVFKDQIPYIKVGHLIRFDQNDLVEWINSKKEETKDESDDYSYF